MFWSVRIFISLSFRALIKIGIVQAVNHKYEFRGPFCEESMKIWEQGQFCIKNLTRRGAHLKKFFLQHNDAYLRHRLVKMLHIGFWLYNLLY